MPFGESQVERALLVVRASISVRAILDEAVQRALFAESKLQGAAIEQNTAELNRQSAEILKFVAENL